jgi:hypothetical protein
MLDKNFVETGSARFSTNEDEIWLVAQRSLLDIDPSEIAALVQNVTFVADNEIQYLTTEFGILSIEDS